MARTATISSAVERVTTSSSEAMMMIFSAGALAATHLTVASVWMYFGAVKAMTNSAEPEARTFYLEVTARIDFREESKMMNFSARTEMTS